MLREVIDTNLDQEQYQLGMELAHGVMTNLYEHAEYKATHDALTGTLNLEGLNNVLKEIDHSNTPVAMLFVDGDKIKRINDNLGHAAGDRAIIGTADTLESCIRDGDQVARVGGDEFVVLLTGSPRAQTDSKDTFDQPKESTLDAIVETTKLRLTKCVKKFQDMNPDLTEQGFDLSVGAAVRKPGASFTETKTVADAGMYKHKQRETSPMTEEKKLAFDWLKAFAGSQGINSEDIVNYFRTR